ncbi:MAG: AAA family ATPase, partial [Microthrixaceae bacterium]
MDRLRAIEQLPTFAVRRPRLEELLDKVPPGGLGLVVAGAGSGKSVLVSQWIASHPDDCVASMVLTDRHNDPMVLGGELLNALEPVQLPLDPGLRKHLVSGTAGLGEHFFDKLLADLAAQPHDVVIVLDDAHQLTRQELLRDLGQFVDRLPDNVRLVTAARWDPELNLRKLRMSGRLVEVRAADLAFDADEASRMVRSVSGRDLDERQARRLVERTDGWAAGLQIAGISLRAAREVAEFIADFAGTDRLVV